jgi:hypothetical protein
MAEAHTRQSMQGVLHHRIAAKDWRHFVGQQKLVRRFGSSGLDMAMIAIERFMPDDRCMLDAVRLFFGREDLDILAQHERAIGILLQDFGYVALAAQRVNGRDGTFDSHYVQELQDSDDLVGLFTT